MYYKHMKALNILLICSVIGCTPKEAKPTIKVPVPVTVLKKRTSCNEKPVVVAVIDTGFSKPYGENPKLCNYGHKDFTNIGISSSADTAVPVPIDNHGHGTNIAGVIQKFAGNSNFCMVILKYYDPKDTGSDNLKRTIRAINYATNIGANYINYSGGGMDHSIEEKKAIKNFLDKGGKFIAAAGNERSDLKLAPYYPAMDDDRIVVVGSADKSGAIASYSNYGERVNRWEYGTNQVGFGISMSGTSQAAAVATGKIINESECDK